MSQNPTELPHGRRASPPWQPAIPATRSPSPVDNPATPRQPWFLPTNWDRRAFAIIVSGRARGLVNRVAFSMAQSLDAAPFWLEIVEHGEVPEPLRMGWVPPERLYVTERPEDLEPARAVGNLALWGVVRSDEPATLLAQLTDFVRLPPLVQEVLGRTAADSQLRAVAVGNADRIGPLFSQRPDEVTWLVDFLRASSLCLILASTGYVGPSRTAFDCEFHVTGDSLERWSEATITCERSRVTGTVPIGRPFPIRAIPGIESLFERRSGSTRTGPTARDAL